MPKRVLDFDALWASDKIASCPGWAQAEYAWLYGLADASGSFELTNLRVIWGRVAAVRKDLTLERLEQIFQEFIARGLLFTWEAGGKRYGHWTGSDVPGRLPPPSWRARLERLAPPVPKQELAAYMARFSAGRVSWKEHRSDEDEMTQGPVRAKATQTGTLSYSSNSQQLKLGLEETQGQEWDEDWNKNENEKKKDTDVRECASAPFALECATSVPVEKNTSAQKSSAEELLDIYERERGNLPAAMKLTPERRRQCAMRLRSGLKPREFAEAVRRAAATPFLAGEGSRGWRASFDWFIANDTNVRKVIEGVYDAGAKRETNGNGNSMNARDRAVYSELNVGSGPVAADYGVRVRPEVLERIRKREAARGG